MTSDVEGTPKRLLGQPSPVRRILTTAVTLDVRKLEHRRIVSPAMFLLRERDKDALGVHTTRMRRADPLAKMALKTVDETARDRRR